MLIYKYKTCPNPTKCSSSRLPNHDAGLSEKEVTRPESHTGWTAQPPFWFGSALSTVHLEMFATS